MSTLAMLTGNSHEQTTGFSYVAFDELLERVKEPAQIQADDIKTAKAKAPICAPHDAPAKTKGAVLEHDRYTMLWGDVDEGNKELAELGGELVAQGLESYAIYSTANSTEENKRWRVLVELDEAVSHQEWLKLQGYLSQVIGGDQSALRPTQILYLPFKCEHTQHFDSYIAKGDALDIQLSEFAANARAYYQQMEAERTQKEVSALDAPKRPLNLASGQQSPIELFNETHDIGSLLETYGFKKSGSKYIHPSSQSGMAGVVLLDDGKKYYSHHQSDPLNDGYKHDAFDVWVELAHGGNFDAAVKQAAQGLDPEGNKQRQREYRQNQAQQDAYGAFSHAIGAGSPLVPVAPEQHPLARFVELKSQPEPPSWVLPQFIAEGVVLIAGGHGVGKTTVLLPLAMAAAGIHPRDYELSPEHWRHVVYITEDVAQAQRIITGYGEWLKTYAPDVETTIAERVHIVEAQRSPAESVARVGSYYREQFSRTISVFDEDVEILPLVVIDTLAATIQLENENDNSEASRAIAALKQQFAGLPIWIIGHTAKANLGRSEGVTARGASAFEADANQVLYLVNEEAKGRWLMRGKTRFDSPYPELEVKSDYKIIEVTNRFGEIERLTLRWAIAYPATGSRADRVKRAKHENEVRDHEDLRHSILTAVQDAYDEQLPLNRTALRGKLRSSASKVAGVVEELISECFLYEVEVPAQIRLQNKKHFLVRLDSEQRSALMDTGEIPEIEIPPSWRQAEQAS